MCLSASTMHAPVHSGRYSSRPKISKEQVVMLSRRWPGCRPGALAMAATKLDSAPWGTITPLGLPVEPEV
ncbi:hypothetical protein D3C81_1242650 [compost metagenome]